MCKPLFYGNAIRTVFCFILFVPLFFWSFSKVNSQEIVCTALDNFENTTELGDPGVDLTFDMIGPIDILDDGSPGVLGTYRDVTFGPLTGFVGASIEVSTDQTFDYSNNAGSRAPVSILYDAQGTGLNIDMSSTLFIRLILISNDNPNTDGNITLSDSSNSSTLSMPNLPNRDEGDSFPAELEYPIDAFPQIQNLDLINIQSIELGINPINNSVDLRISLIEICGPPSPPEPKPIPTLSEWGLIAMAGVLGIAGLLVVRQRKPVI